MILAAVFLFCLCQKDSSLASAKLERLFGLDLPRMPCAVLRFLFCFRKILSIFSVKVIKFHKAFQAYDSTRLHEGLTSCFVLQKPS